MKDSMVMYGITLGIRFTKKQKQMFLSYVEEVLNKKGMMFSYLNKGNLRNLVIGDIEKASYIILAGFDTPSISRIKDIKYFPFNPTLQIKIEKKNFIINTSISMLCLLISISCIIVMNYLSSIIFKVIVIIFSVIMLYFSYCNFSTKGNTLNFNKNSAAIALLFEIIEELGTKNIAYILLDDTSNSYTSIKLVKQLINKQQVVIHLDGIASGKELLLAYHQDTKDEIIDKLFNHGKGVFDRKKSYNKDKENIVTLFAQSIYITSGSIINHQFVIPYTRSEQDYKVDMERLTLLKKELITFLLERRYVNLC